MKTTIQIKYAKHRTSQVPIKTIPLQNKNHMIIASFTMPDVLTHEGVGILTFVNKPKYKVVI